MPAPGGRPPFGLEGAGHLSRSASPGTGTRYGLQRVCRLFGLAHVLGAGAHCPGAGIGRHVAQRGDRFEALEPLRQGAREHFGGFAAKVAEGLTSRHDPGSTARSDDFQGELTSLGMVSSPSCVRAPEGNGCAARFIRTPKRSSWGSGASARWPSWSRRRGSSGGRATSEG